MEKKRSVGVFVCGIIAIVISLYLLYAYITLSDMPPPDRISLIMPGIIAISFFISGIFILRLKNWARILFMIQMVYYVFVGLRGVTYILSIEKIFKGHISQMSWLAWLLLFFLPSVSSIYYLTRPKVKEQFK